MESLWEQGLYNPDMQPLDLPPPSKDALEVSQHLTRILRRAIDRSDGWISFERYMQIALYEPMLGYYAGGSRKFGPGGDFTTGPEMTPLFGACLATQIAQWFEQVPARVVEFGGGSGALAAQILNELGRLGHQNVRYELIELSGDLRDRQQQTLRTLSPMYAGQVDWLDEMPRDVEGVVIANELLDALPVTVFKAMPDRILERGVIYSGDDAQPFQWQDRPADESLSRRVRAKLGAFGWPDDAGWPREYVSECAPLVEAWVSTLTERIKKGAALFLDYGFPAHEYYHPQRAQGTLMCHYRHRSHAEPFFSPGLSDITAHVDFDLVADAASSAGGEVLFYSNQARFLINCGMLERLAKLDVNQTTVYARQSQAAQKLLSEAEMGELFKVIAIGKGMRAETIGGQSGDRRSTLSR